MLYFHVDNENPIVRSTIVATLRLTLPITTTDCGSTTRIVGLKLGFPPIDSITILQLHIGAQDPICCRTIHVAVYFGFVLVAPHRINDCNGSRTTATKSLDLGDL